MDILNNFGIRPTLLIAQIVNFVIILFLLKKFFYKPILKVLDDRKKRIEQSLKNADAIEEKLGKTEEQSSKIIQDAQLQAQNLIAEAKKEAEIISQKATQDARLTAEEFLSNAKIQLEAERLQMQEKLEKETLELVAVVVKKVLKRSLKPGEKQELTTSSAHEITSQLKWKIEKS